MEKVRREGSLYTPDAGGIGYVDEVIFKKNYYTKLLEDKNITALCNRGAVICGMGSIPSIIGI